MADEKIRLVRSSKRETNWPQVLLYIHVHVLAMYGLWLACTSAMLLTNLFCLLLSVVGVLGATCGAHRLWSHKAFEAKLPLRILLMICQTLVGQGSIYSWVREHRLHHAQFGTPADPYDSSRGFLFAHMQTHLLSPSLEQEALIREMDNKDLENDGVVMFQKRFYWLLYPILFLLLPINAPVEYWGESILNSVFVLGFVRYAIVLHMAWLINSSTLVWGLKPGDKYPADTNMVFIMTKSYWPQYHYLMPWDYKTGEYGTYGSGCSTTFIRMWAAMGWATGLRTMDSSAVKEALAVAVKTGEPVKNCLEKAEATQKLQKDHFLAS